MLGIVPAAGIGSRIQPLAFSKELLPVGSVREGNAERPRAVSEYLAERLVRGGATWAPMRSSASRGSTSSSSWACSIDCVIARDGPRRFRRRAGGRRRGAEKYAHDWTNWWIPNRACVEAVMPKRALRHFADYTPERIEELAELCSRMTRRYG